MPITGYVLFLYIHLFFPMPDKRRQPGRWGSRAECAGGAGGAGDAVAAGGSEPFKCVMMPWVSSWGLFPAAALSR